jgi:hypothetical protein
VRFDLSGPATVDGAPAQLRDASLTGASLLLPPGAVTAGQPVWIGLPLPGAALSLPAVVRSVAPAGEFAQQVGVEFRDPPPAAVADLALSLFRTGITPRLVHPAETAVPVLVG